MMHVKVVKGKIGVAMNGVHKGWGRGATQSVPVGSVYVAPVVRRLEPADKLKIGHARSDARSAYVTGDGHVPDYRTLKIQV